MSTTEKSFVRNLSILFLSVALLGAFIFPSQSLGVIDDQGPVDGGGGVIDLPPDTNPTVPPDTNPTNPTIPPTNPGGGDTNPGGGTTPPVTAAQTSLLPTERPIIDITNYTNNPGCTSCWSQSISNVKPGDVVSVVLYYRNTGGNTAYNARGYLSVGNGTITGTIAADNAPTINRSVSFSPVVGKQITLVPQGNTNFSFGNVPASGPDCSGQVVVRFTVQEVGTTPPPPTSNTPPKGYHDGASGNVSLNECKAFGWATDTDTPNTPVTVRVYIDGQSKVDTTAGFYRGDLINVCSGGRCAFTVDLANLLSHNTPHTIRVVAYDTTTGASYDLNNTPKTLTCNDTTTTTPPPTTPPPPYYPPTPPPPPPYNPPVPPTTYTATATATASASATASCPNGTTATASASASATATATSNISQADAQQKAQEQAQASAYAQAYAQAQAQISCPSTPPPPPPPPPCIPVSVQTLAATYVGSGTAVLNGLITPNNTSASYRFEYGTDANNLNQFTPYVSVSGNSPIPVSVTINGLASNTVYYFRLVANSACGSQIGTTLSFGNNTPPPPPCIAPVAETLQANSIGTNSVNLNARINPNGNQVSYRFEYGTDPNNLNQFTPFYSLSNGNSYVNVSYTVTNLNPNTTYYFRIVVMSGCGNATGVALYFRTTGNPNPPPPQCIPPVVQTISATNIGNNTVTLNAQVNANGSQTYYRFEYGTSPGNLNHSTSLISAGSANGFIYISRTISGLAANTTYYFRIVASNDCGSDTGTVLYFRTGKPYVPPVTPKQPKIPATGGEDTTPAELTASIDRCPSISSKNPLRQGDEITYNLTYRNPDNKAIRNAVLTVSMPFDTNFVSSNPSPDTQYGNTVTYNLGKLAANAQGTIAVKIQVKDNAAFGSILPFNSTLQYTDDSNAVQSISASPLSLQIARDGSNDNASGNSSSVGSIGNAFSNVPGYFWFFLMLLLIIILIAAYFFRLLNEKKATGDVIITTP